MSIEVKNISKNYGRKTKALDNVSLEFESGKIYGLLGRNGAGKSTLLNIISNRIFADSGEILVDGENAVENDKALSKLYMTCEKTLFSKNIKITQLFQQTKMFNKSFNIKKAEKYAKLFDIKTNKYVGSLSTGMKTILKDIIALSMEVPYILLDEPVLGLDAVNRDLFYKLLLERYSECANTIIIATHLIEEISGIIEKIVVINCGKIISNTTSESLLENCCCVTGSIESITKFIKGRQTIFTEISGNCETAYIIEKINKEELSDGITLDKPSLQTIFIKMTN